MIHVSTTVNGDAHELLCDPRETLLDALRDRLELTGAKKAAAPVIAAPAPCFSMVVRSVPAWSSPRKRKGTRSGPSRA